MIPRPGNGRCRIALLLVLITGLLAAVLAGCSSAAISGPPLVLLDAYPAGGVLGADLKVTLVFNLPLDAASLKANLKIEPAAKYETTVTGSIAVLELIGPVPGRTYAVSVGAGTRGYGGATLQRDYSRAFSVAPSVQLGDKAVLPGSSTSGQTQNPGAGGQAPADTAAGIHILGAKLTLEGFGVYACDRPGFYSAPRFDSVRLLLGGAGRLDPSTIPAVLEVRPDGAVRRLPARQTGGAGWVQLELEEETRPGWTYELCIVSGTAADPKAAVTYSLYAWSVHGGPRIYVWSLDMPTGRTSPVGKLNLGMEIDELVGAPGGFLAAVGNPGGAAWSGLQLVQALTHDVQPAGPPVAVFADGNYLSRQVGYSGSSAIAVGPASSIPARVGEDKWAGFVPPKPPDPRGAWTGNRPSGEAVLDRGSDSELPLLVEIRAGAAGVVLFPGDLPGRFVSGPAVSRDGSKLAFLTHDFSDRALVRVWALNLTEGALSSTQDPQPVLHELARLVYPNETASDFGYGGGISWRAGASGLWWDVCLPDGTAEIWAVDAAGGARSLVASGAALPLVSPDGRMLFARGLNEGLIIAADGSVLRRVPGPLTAASWFPDNSGLLVTDSQGIQLVPVSGPVKRLVTFAASPGCFVSPTEYWFVSDRRF